MKTKSNMLKRLLLSALLVVSLSSVSFASTTTYPQTNQQTITMTLSQYNELKMIIDSLEMNLQILEQNSSTDKKQLIELRNELETCKSQMLLAQKSSEKAESLLKEVETSLKTLTEQMDSLKHKLAVKERQNKLAWSVAGGLLIGLVAK